MTFNSKSAAEAGRKGGLTTVERHGRSHMQQIGRKGFHAVVKKHYGGDYRRAINVLINRGLMATDPNPENGAWTVGREVDWLPTAYKPPTPEETW